MDLNDYQRHARRTAIYPPRAAIMYPALGLAGEAGEVSNIIKKVIRDRTDVPIDKLRAELGDVLWYVAVLADDLGLKLEDIALDNIAKLAARKSRGTLSGSGDDR
jgi:NTP pyrophosphatase (non-canonical NTP hydrolase)